MNIAIGFGVIEANFEKGEEDAFTEFVTARFRELSLDYFTSEFAKEVEGWVEKRTKAYRLKSDEYRKADSHPDRYSTYWGSVLESASDIVLVAHFFHTNRRHAFSPDGWASMQTKRLFHVSALDIKN